MTHLIILLLGSLDHQPSSIPMNLKTIKLLGIASLVSLFATGSALAQATGTDQYTMPTQSSVPGAIGFIIWLVVVVLMVASGWKVFSKAGQPGWAILIPIFNTYITLKVIGRPWWWLLLLFIPFVNFIIWILMMLNLAKSFGKGVGFAIGLIFLPFIFYPILGFGNANYHGPTVSI